MTSTGDPVWIFDLDGTVITVNSFPLWVRHLGLGRIPGLTIGRKLVTGLAVAAALAERKVARRGHAHFKQRLQWIWARTTTRQTDQAAAEDFADHVLRYRRPSLEGLIDQIRLQRLDAILATAAAEEYAGAIAARLGFRHHLATPRGAASNRENIAAAKRDAVLDLMARNGWTGRPIVLATDHPEDLPLIEISWKLLWCGSAAHLGEIRAAVPAIPVLDLEAAGSDRIRAFVSAAA